MGVTTADGRQMHFGRRVTATTCGISYRFAYGRLRGAIGDVPPADREVGYYRQPDAVTSRVKSNRPTVCTNQGG